MLLVLALSACGSDGDDGAPGAPGTPGAPAGVDISNATSLNAQITGASVASPPVVTFSLTDENGNPVKNLPASSISFNFAKLVPGTDGNASAWQSYINQVEEPGVGPGTTSQIQATTESGSAGTLVDNGDGTYSYTFATDVTNVTTPIPVSFVPNLTHRVSFEVRGFAPVDNPVYDFRPSDGATTGLFSREIVETETCNGCHERLALHGGARFRTQECVTCHNPGSTDANSGNTVDYKVMIHKIHRGEELPSVVAGTDYCIYGFRDSLNCYGDVVFPQDVRNCSNCHNADDPATPQAANWYTVPTQEACGSCHDDVNFATGEGHAENDLGLGIVADNSQCAGCHATSPTSRLEVRQAHRLLVEEAAARFKFNIPAVAFNGLGTAPAVLFSVTDPTNGDQPYDLATDPAITRSNLRFTLAWNTADYFNDGSGSAPAQTARTSVIADFSVPPDGVSELNPAAIDNGDGTYSMALSTIPATSTIPITGSGAITLEGHPVVDIGAAAEEVPATTAAVFFGITDDPANPTARRQKVDIARCDNCHERLSLHGANRNDNPNACVTCHNANATDIGRRPTLSDAGAVNADGKAEEAIDFKYMIHKIHAADIVVYGFGGSVNDFTEVRYPQRLTNCTACHTDDGFYPVSFDSGVLATTIDTGTVAGSGVVDNDPLNDVNVTPNTSACSSCHSDAEAALHMQQNGGSFDACQAADGGLSIRVDTCGGTPGPTTSESCTVCHKAGAIADVAVMHDVDLGN
jgi:OmcA/MtrC family decaheme c-type cytochrome